MFHFNLKRTALRDGFYHYQPVSYQTMVFNWDLNPWFDTPIFLRRYTPLGARKFLQQHEAGKKFFNQVRVMEEEILLAEHRTEIKRDAQRYEQQIIQLVLRKDFDTTENLLAALKTQLGSIPPSPLRHSYINMIREFLDKSGQVSTELWQEMVDSAESWRAYLQEPENLELRPMVDQDMRRTIQQLLDLFAQLQDHMTPQPTEKINTIQPLYLTAAEMLPSFVSQRVLPALSRALGWVGPVTLQASEDPGYTPVEKQLEAIRAALAQATVRSKKLDDLRELLDSRRSPQEKVVRLKQAVKLESSNLLMVQNRSRPGHETFLSVLGRPGEWEQREWFHQIVKQAILPVSSIQMVLDQTSLFVDITQPNNPRVYDLQGTRYYDLESNIRDLMPSRTDIADRVQRSKNTLRQWNRSRLQALRHPFFKNHVSNQACYFQHFLRWHSAVLVEGTMRGDELIEYLEREHADLLQLLGNTVIRIHVPHLTITCEREDLFSANTLTHKSQLEQIVRDFLSKYFVSDVHIGDGRKTDLITDTKLKSFEKFLQHVAAKQSWLVLGGDILDGLQGYLHGIIDLRSETLALLSQIHKVFYVIGNHDIELSAANALNIGKYFISRERRRRAEEDALVNTQNLRAEINHHAQNNIQFREVLVDNDSGIIYWHGHLSDSENMGSFGNNMYRHIYVPAFHIFGERFANWLEYTFAERFSIVLQRYWPPYAKRVFEYQYDRSSMLVDVLNYLRATSPLHRDMQVEELRFSIGSGHTHYQELPGGSPVEKAMQIMVDKLTWNPPHIQWFNSGSFTTPTQYKFSLKRVNDPGNRFAKPSVLKYCLGSITVVEPEEWEQSSQAEMTENPSRAPKT